jgi:hypothetical protein
VPLTSTSLGTPDKRCEDLLKVVHTTQTAKGVKK